VFESLIAHCQCDALRQTACNCSFAGVAFFIGDPLQRPTGYTNGARTTDRVGVLARALGLCLNACRVAYVVEEEEPVRRFAFAYGTLPEHAESGEERFQVELLEDDYVWYDILAFSRPNQLLARLAYP
jgi:uncharacterized protein (UPF0548 family)